MCVYVKAANYTIKSTAYHLTYIMYTYVYEKKILEDRHTPKKLFLAPFCLII